MTGARGGPTEIRLVVMAVVILACFFDRDRVMGWGKEEEEEEASAEDDDDDTVRSGKGGDSNGALPGFTNSNWYSSGSMSRRSRENVYSFGFFCVH